MTAGVRMLRLVWWSTMFHLKIMSRSLFLVAASLIQPLILATIGFYLFGTDHRADTWLWLALGAGFLGVWASTLFGSGAALGEQRHQGTLELMVAAPAPLLATLLPITLASAAIGLYSLVATLLWGWLLFGLPLAFAHPGWLVAAVPAAVLALGALGLIIAGSFILYRYANALSNLLETPVWLVSGLLVPTAALPGWTHPVGWLLAPTWGVRALRAATIGGDPRAPIAACVGLTVLYLATGALILRYVEGLACRHGSLALA